MTDDNTSNNNSDEEKQKIKVTADKFLKADPDFVTEMFEQNLAHARHVEIERLTYCAASSALIVGGLAAVGAVGIDDQISRYISIIISVILFLISLLSFFLNERWSKAFEEHTGHAEACYRILHIKKGTDQEENFRTISKEDMLYRFDITNPFKIRTKWFFRFFYCLMILMTLTITLYLIAPALI